jgi:hypothetical protein
MLSKSENEKIRGLASEVSRAAARFESRWTLAALRRVDLALHRRFVEQRNLTDEAFVTGSVEAVEEHAAAMQRGYAAAIRALEAAAEPDDAYQLGHDNRTGLTIAIGEQRAAAERVRDLHGERVVWVTADEVAGLVAGLEQFKTLAAVKRLFPGAEAVDLYEDESAKSDAA